MSESETEDVVVEEVEGVTITKYFDEEEFHFPSMVLEFDSHRNEPVDLRVEEAKPEGISIENIGFHPAHGADYWSIEDETLVFEYTLEANAEYRTVYALRTKSATEARGMFAEPDVVDVEPPLPETGEAEPESAIARSTSNSPYREEEEGEAGEPAPEEPEASEPETGELDLEEPEDSSAEDEPAAESVVEQLARELREGSAPDESLSYVESQFGSDAEPSGSLEARLTQMQEDVSNLRSYTNALEEFLDDEGTAEEIIDEFETRMDGFEDDVDRVESSTESLESELRALRDEVSDVRSSVDSLSADYAELTDELADIREDVAETEDRLPEYDIDEQFAEIETDLADLDEFVQGLRSAFD